MREIFTDQDSAIVGHYKSVLDSAGIPSFIRNGLSNNLLTGMPSPVMFPTLCVDDDDYDKAMELLRAIHRPQTNDAPDWICAACKEAVPGTFDTCWKCGHEAAEKTAVVITKPTSVVPSAPDVGGIPRSEVRRAVDILRGLILASGLFVVGFKVAGDSAYQSFDIYPPNALSGLERVYAWFSSPIEFVALIFCFFLMRMGRTMYLFHVAASTVLYPGSTGGITSRTIGLLSYTSSLITGAIIAMLFLSPAAACFQKKRE